MLGMLIFAVAVFRGNIKGRLHVSYILMMLYSAIMFIMAILPRQYQIGLANEKIEMNTLIYFIAMILTVLVFTVFILREKGRIRVIPKFSSVMLLVIIRLLPFILSVKVI